MRGAAGSVIGERNLSIGFIGTMAHTVERFFAKNHQGICEFGETSNVIRGIVSDDKFVGARPDFGSAAIAPAQATVGVAGAVDMLVIFLDVFECRRGTA